MRETLKALVVLGGSVLAAGAAQAANITIDDTDASKIRIQWSDFDRGAGLTISRGSTIFGSGASGDLTLDDQGYTINGSWLFNPPFAGAFQRVGFALASAPTDFMSGIAYSVTRSGSVATLSGSIAGFTGSAYATSISNLLTQDGRTGNGASTNLTVSFTSEPLPPRSESVPEPATLALLGLGLAGLGLARRRRA